MVHVWYGGYRSFPDELAYSMGFDHRTSKSSLYHLYHLLQLYRLYRVLLVNPEKNRDRASAFIGIHQHSSGLQPGRGKPRPYYARFRASAFIGVHQGCTQGGASPAPTVHDFTLQHSSG
jgi:hypothetical protein